MERNHTRVVMTKDKASLIKEFPIVEKIDGGVIYLDRPAWFSYNLTKIDPPMRRYGVTKERLDDFA